MYKHTMYTYALWGPLWRFCVISPCSMVHCHKAAPLHGQLHFACSCFKPRRKLIENMKVWENILRCQSTSVYQFGICAGAYGSGVILERSSGTILDGDGVCPVWRAVTPQCRSAIPV